MFSTDLQPALTLYSALSNPPFRTLKIRGKKQTCLACSGDGAKALLDKSIAADKAGQWTFGSCGVGEGVTEGDERISIAASLVLSNQ